MMMLVPVSKHICLSVLLVFSLLTFANSYDEPANAPNLEAGYGNPSPRYYTTLAPYYDAPNPDLYPSPLPYIEAASAPPPNVADDQYHHTTPPVPAPSTPLFGTETIQQPPPLDDGDGDVDVEGVEAPPADRDASLAAVPAARSSVLPSNYSAEDEVNEFSQEQEASWEQNKSRAGVAIGVAVGICVVGLAGFVYKKRKYQKRRMDYECLAKKETI